MNPLTLWHFSQSTTWPARVAVLLWASLWQAPQVAKAGFLRAGVEKFPWQSTHFTAACLARSGYLVLSWLKRSRSIRFQSTVVWQSVQVGPNCPLCTSAWQSAQLSCGTGW